MCLEIRESKDDMKNNIILSIVISTYNRCDLLMNNICMMLESQREDIEFIISDNCSQDDTWQRLNAIRDKRVKVFRNDENFGAINVIAAFGFACGEYIINVNDRDYIKAENIDRLCEKLKKINYCDVVATFGRKRMKEGYCRPQAFWESFLMCDHPGSVIYNRKFYENSVNLREVIKQIHTKTLLKPNISITYDLMINMSKCYFFPPTMIEQPSNRDYILQTRKEYYGTAFILPEYHIKEFDDLAKYILDNRNEKNIEAIFVERYRNALKRVMGDFRQFIDSPNYKNRNHCEGSKSDWFKNGYKYFTYVYHSGCTKELNLKKKFLIIAIKETLLESLRSIRDMIKGR